VIGAPLETPVTNSVTRTDSGLYQALFELAQSISGHTDPDSLCRSLAQALSSVVRFDFLGLVLHDAAENVLRLHGLATTRPVRADSDESQVALLLDDNPAGWVWRNQEAVIIPRVSEETRWPEFMAMLLERGAGSVSLVPLTNGERRLGVLVLVSMVPNDLAAHETAFLRRVASEVAVTIDAQLAHQELIRERDRLRVLFEITNALVSKLSWDELLAAICTVLGRFVPLAGAAITVLDKAKGKLLLHAFHVADNIWLDVDRTPVSFEDLPSGKAIASGEPIITTCAQFQQFPLALSRQMEERGIKVLCSIPLKTANGTIGTLELGRTAEESFTGDQVEFLVQAARQIAIALENSLAFRELAEVKEKLAIEKLYLEEEIRFDQNLGNMVGESPAFQALLKSIQIVAPTDATVLIEGETGTGKELVARAIHEASSRKGESFVKVNCAAIPATLLESELFGHEKGAFTGAVSQKIGRFELANGGTLFLDEIGEIPLELQPKLLRAIQEQEFERLGSNRTIRVDVRLIAATNQSLKRLVDENKFRSDLYYRLHVFPIHVPPLRERREDIPLLVRYFTHKFAQRMNRRIESIPSHVMDSLIRYDWPGNIRSRRQGGLGLPQRGVGVIVVLLRHRGLPTGRRPGCLTGDGTTTGGINARTDGSRDGESTAPFPRGSERGCGLVHDHRRNEPVRSRSKPGHGLYHAERLGAAGQTGPPR